MITKPTLLIDEKKCRENINRMFLKAKHHKVDFRPHFKTHQSLEIGSWFKELGVNKITVSSVEMAKYFSEEWDNITIAFPVNILEIQDINELASRITLNLVIENTESISFLSEHLVSNVDLFLKIDVGYHRTGINPEDRNLIDAILKVIDANHHLTFTGFLGHAGHTYKCRTGEAIRRIHSASSEIMSGLKALYKSQYPNLIVSLGDTPGCSVVEDFAGVDEIRPGNFVFYDLTQHKIGSNAISQIAVAMACPIVAIHEERSEIVVYGGGVHFSKDSLEDKEGVIYGRGVEKRGELWGDIIPGMFVKSLSQEHGIISVLKTEMNNYRVGDYLIILPVHSCMTANSMKSYLNSNKVITRL
jgi:D-serine deaminase-like pyridoxal phosphate-dependent protein